jgi:hypothetical protein
MNTRSTNHKTSDSTLFAIGAGIIMAVALGLVVHGTTAGPGISMRTRPMTHADRAELASLPANHRPADRS